jgi:hypothetical protein
MKHTDVTPRSRSRRFRIVAIAVIVVGVALATLSIRSLEDGQSQGVAIQSPVATTLSWFASINAHDKPLAIAHFVPADRDMMEWTYWGMPFTGLHCSLMHRSTLRASVYCKFNVINDPNMGMGNVSFWSVSLQREPSGRWLINNYGQG